jgi:hypothetical protein
VVGTMLGPGAWSTKKRHCQSQSAVESKEGPTACWADMEALPKDAGHGGTHWSSVRLLRHFNEHTDSI